MYQIWQKLLFLNREFDLYTGSVFHQPYLFQKTALSGFPNPPAVRAGISSVEGNPNHSVYSGGVRVSAYQIGKLAPSR